MPGGGKPPVQGFYSNRGLITKEKGFTHNAYQPTIGLLSGGGSTPKMGGKAWEHVAEITGRS